MYIIPLVTTLCSSICSGTVISRYIGTRGTIIVSLLCLISASLSSMLIWYEVCIVGEIFTFINVFDVWFSIGTFNVAWHVYIDIYTAQMLLTVTMVSCAVHFYAVVYMKSDPHLTLFMSYLSLFTFFMLVLVCSDNLICMLVGWEGIGVCSYLLIGYYSHRLAASKSAQKAILVNRVSDGLLLWGILWIWWYTGTLEYDLILLNNVSGGFINADIYTKEIGVYNTENISAFLSISILIGAMGKSAQILFHVWLADSMEGPTPVSALIHAATLVTAGVYIMVRLSIFYSDGIIIIGSLTAIIAGVFGYFQSDIKRIIAFSTCSQLGYMMVSVGSGDKGADGAMSHLMTHASFKAALFLAAGVFIMSAGQSQSINRYGSISMISTNGGTKSLCFITLLICCLCLMALPETSGFYSKETIINLSYILYNPLADYAHTLLLLAAFITCTYTVKLFAMSYFYDFNGYNFNTDSIKENTFYTYGLISIAFLILLFDVLLKIWVGTGTPNSNGLLYFIPWFVKTLPFGLLLAGLLTATTAVTSTNFGIMRLNATRFGFDQIYARTLVLNVLDSGRITFYSGDKGLFVL
uniref:NADH-ubiquinone oxidoreductase chain 5 n=1 Tax=Haematococcus lacustris TaxID=44745 RepID=A0A5B9R233_HAELA|nr:NADH dehydrogenase subunit 5 [Haematococcus lacustris]QEG54848.1 NADH dehydrogenase subunit 5 [Haematococcus lacustris]